MSRNMSKNSGRSSDTGWFDNLELKILDHAPAKTGIPSSQWSDLIRRVLTSHLDMLDTKTGEILKDAPETAVTIVRLEGLPAFCVKQFNDRGMFHRIKGLFRNPQGIRTFLNGSCLISNGIPAATPLALIRKRNRGLVCVEWVIMEFMQNFMELDRYLVRKFEHGWLKDEQKSAVRQFGRFIGSMHSKGIFHSDLKTCNIMVSEDFSKNDSSSGSDLHETKTDSSSLKFCLVDYDDVNFTQHISKRKRVKNLVQIFLSTPSLLNRVERMRFLDEYALHAGLSPEERKHVAHDVLRNSHGRKILYVGFKGDVTETMDLK